MFKRHASWILCGLVVAAIGCTAKSGIDVSASASSGSTDTTEAPTDNGTDTVDSSAKTIGFSAMDLANPFFQLIADTLTEHAKEQGFEVMVEDSSSDPKKQSEHIDSFITKQVTAIVLNPCDRYSTGPAIKRANEAGIPVFTCDLQCEAEGAKIAAHVGTDNFGGGKLAGDAMIEALGESGGKVFVLHFPQANSCVLRVDGFKEVIEAHNNDREEGKIEIVGEQDGGGNQNAGFAAASAAIQSYPDLAGIFAINDPSGLGAYTALEQAQKIDQVTIVAFDGQKDGKQAIKDGKIYADPIQFPRKMASMTMDNIMKNLSGEEYVAVTLIPTELYRKADAEKDPELQ
ncbi:MAG: sugar ABC transporter substrate-binding protein [Planctomycetaceae bacterium]|nr:sugar ABC transporter substrate-binding protein [Planctomycetaceae bacterium]